MPPPRLLGEPAQVPRIQVIQAPVWIFVHLYVMSDFSEIMSLLSVRLQHRPCSDDSELRLTCVSVYRPRLDRRLLDKPCSRIGKPANLVRTTRASVSEDQAAKLRPNHVTSNHVLNTSANAHGEKKMMLVGLRARSFYGQSHCHSCASCKLSPQHQLL